jgi:hypothetical protein
LPFLKDSLLGTNDAVLNDVNLAGLRDFTDQNIRSDPTGAARGCRERFAFFDGVANEEVLWNDEKIYEPPAILDCSSSATGRSHFVL